MNIQPGREFVPDAGGSRNLPAFDGARGMMHAGGFGRDEADDDIQFDPLRLLWLAVHYRWLIASLLAIGLVLSAVVTWMQTPIFRATAKIEIMTAGARVVQDLEVVSQTSDMRAYETAREKILSRDLARRIVYELNLSEKPDFLAPVARFSLLNIVRKAAGSSASDGVMELEAEVREKAAIAKVQSGLSASLLRNTSLIEISFLHPSPEIAAEIASQAARSYIDQTVDARGATSNLAREFIQEQVIETKKKLEGSEKELVDYAKSAGITITGSDASLIAQNISKINESLAEAIDEKLTAERALVQVREGATASLPQAGESKSIQNAKDKIIELKATYQEKLAALKPGYPEMRQLKSQIEELNRQLQKEIAAIGRSVEIQFDQAVGKEQALRDELAKLESAQAAFQEKNITYTILKREVDSNRSQYDSLISKLNDVGVGADLKNANANVLDFAIVPDRPHSPRLLLNLALGLILAAAAAAGGIFVLELINNTFAIPDQVESELQLPVLGVLPDVNADKITDEMADEKSGLSEAYRTLRTSLQFTGTEGAIKTLLITSSEPSEGKSTTVFKLAQDFAALGRSILVIDADMRKPRMHRMFNTDIGIGLSNLLSNVVHQNDVQKIFRQTDNPHVSFLSAGTIPPNPSDLLMSSKMGLALHYVARKYDLVIVDAPPIMGLSDAVILGRLVDSTLLVVAAKQSHRKAAKAAAKRMRAAGANIVGVAFSKFAVNRTDYNYAYRYMNHNYYNYGGDDPKLEDKSGRARKNAEAGPLGDIGAWFNRFARRFG